MGAHEERAAIRPVKESVEDELIARPGVVGVDIAEKETGGEKTGELSIVVFVEAKKPKSKLTKGTAIPAEIDGIKTDVQELTIELQPEMRLLDEDRLQVDPADYPTLVGGISIGPQRSIFLSPPEVDSAGNYVFVGTLGAMVKDRATGTAMALTNFHVAAVNSTWSVGDRQVQPSLVDGGATTGDFGSLTRAMVSENIDGAVITLDAGQDWSPQVAGIGDVAGATAAVVGMAVQKRGRTTEHTFGTVISTDATVTINYGSGIGRRTLRNQVRISPDTARNLRFSDSGDSGSVVMDMNRKVIGLLFAGASDGSATFANPIATVMNELSVDLAVAIPSLRSRPISMCYPSRLLPCRTRVGPVCDVLPTKPPVLRPVTRDRSIWCDVRLTRPDVRFTRFPPNCPVGYTRFPDCPPLPTRARWCAWPGDGGWQPPPIAWTAFGGEYGVTAGELELAGEDAFWSGYLAALEEVDNLDATETDPSSGQA